MQEVDGEVERKSRLQSLALIMKEYSMKFHTPEEKLIQNLYTRYNIKSRSELLIHEIDAEIESYKSAILSGIA